MMRLGVRAPYAGKTVKPLLGLAVTIGGMLVQIDGQAGCSLAGWSEEKNSGP